MTYAAGRRILDADSHVMELADFLDDFIDPEQRDRLRRRGMEALKPVLDRAVAASDARKGDAAKAAEAEERLMVDKGWSAMGAFDPQERSRVLDLLGFDAQLVFATFASSMFAGKDQVRLYAGAAAQNKAMIDFCASDPRLLPVAYIPLIDPARPGKDRSKVSIDALTIMSNDADAIAVDWHVEKWSWSKGFCEFIEEKDEDDPLAAGLRDVLRPRAAALDALVPRWPSIGCLHFVVTLRHEGAPYVVWTQRAAPRHASTFQPGKWSCSFEEQLVPRRSFDRETQRALMEELVGRRLASSVACYVLSAFIEQSILNTSFVVWAEWNGSWQELRDAWPLRTDQHETKQMIATPLTVEVLAEVAARGLLPSSPLVLVDDEEVFGATTETRVHSSSLFRMALAAWAVSARGGV